MPLLRKVLRVSNRSMLAFIFFFSSSSCLYFIYVAPGIGESGAAPLGAGGGLGVPGEGGGATDQQAGGDGRCAPAAPGLSRRAPRRGGQGRRRARGAWGVESRGPTPPPAERGSGRLARAGAAAVTCVNRASLFC